MYKFKEHLLEKYFFYGINDREGLLEGMIFFTNDDLNLIYLNIMDDEKLPSLDEKFENLINSVSRNCEQIYKFVDLVQEPHEYKAEIDEETKKRIRQDVFNKIKKLEQEEAFQKYRRGIFFKRSLETNFYYCKEPVYGWTNDVYKVILQLNELENKDPIEYYEKWLKVKMNRTKNKENCSQEEIKQVEKAYGMFQERKSKAMKSQEQEEIK